MEIKTKNGYLGIRYHGLSSFLNTMEEIKLHEAGVAIIHLLPSIQIEISDFSYSFITVAFQWLIFGLTLYWEQSTTTCSCQESMSVMPEPRPWSD